MVKLIQNILGFISPRNTAPLDIDRGPCRISTKIIFMIICGIAFSINTPPVVSNVTFAQRTNGSGIVDVYYDVYDADGDSLQIIMAVISNVSDTSNIFNIDSLISGDVGRGIYSGYGKHIVWQYGTGNPNTYSNQVIIKITADDTKTTPTVTDYDGNEYETIEIGNQLWMSENLKTSHYNNGEVIPTGLSNSSWSTTSSGAVAVYNDQESNADTYGYLYNWYAVVDSRGICPEGYHVPTDDEYKQLEMYLGMSESEANNTGWRGSISNHGSKLAGNSDLWDSGDLANSSEFGTSGFTARPGGYRSYDNGAFYGMGYYGYFWSSTENSSNYAWYRLLDYDYSGVGRTYYFKQSGFSIRCLGD
jgi:uncharacterized protein (TIGR02145 family)